MKTFLQSRTVRAIAASAVLLVVQALAQEHVLPGNVESVLNLVLPYVEKALVMAGLYYARFPRA